MRRGISVGGIRDPVTVISHKLSGRVSCMGGRPFAACAGALRLSPQGWTAVVAVLTSAMCVSACGKFPSMRLARGSYSSANRPTSLPSASRRSKKRFRLLAAPREHVAIRQPKRTCQECPLAGRQGIDARRGRVAQHQSVDQQMLLDGRDRPEHARIIRPAENPLAVSTAGSRPETSIRTTARRCCWRDRSPARRLAREYDRATGASEPRAPSILLFPRP